MVRQHRLAFSLMLALGLIGAAIVTPQWASAAPYVVTPAEDAAPEQDAVDTTLDGATNADTPSSEESTDQEDQAVPDAPEADAQEDDVAVQEEAGAEWLKNTLAVYNIPDAITEVLMQNSRYPDGQSPIEAGQTPADFTLADVAKLDVVSLADRSMMRAVFDGSRPSSVVSDWVAGLAAGATGYDIANNALNQHAADVATALTGPLATREYRFDGHNAGQRYMPPFNGLMLVVASAVNARVVDLTGITSHVANQSQAQFMLALLATPRLTNLISLSLAENNLGNLVEYPMKGSVLAVTAGQHVRDLSLANNQITGAKWWPEFPLMQHLTNLDLSGNAIEHIGGGLNAALDNIIQNAGSGDLSGSNLDAKDWNTLHGIIGLVNQSTGDLKLSDASVNAIFSADVNGGQGVNERAVIKYLPQMSSETAQKVLAQHPEFSDDVKAQLKEWGQGKRPSSGHGSIAVGGRLDFGTHDVGQLAAPMPSSTALTLAATLMPGESLMVSMTPWIGQDGSRFNGILRFAAWPTAISRDPVVMMSAGEQKQLVTKTLDNISLEIAKQDQEYVHATRYTGEVTWTVGQPVSVLQD